MPDRRIRWALGIVAMVMVAGICATWYAVIHRPAAVVISTTSAVPVPAQVSPSPLPISPVPPSLPTTPPPLAAPAPAPIEKYYVHVAGAVRRPSVYLLSPGSRVMHAIKAAGGPTQKADLDALNLAQKVQDGEKIYVPTHAEAAQTTTPVVDSAEDARSEAVGPGVTTGTKSARATSSKPAKLASPAQGQVDINTAGADTLERLPGIGPAMAERIIAYRQQAGRFASTDELMQVSGIGPKKYARIAPLIKL